MEYLLTFFCVIIIFLLLKALSLLERLQSPLAQDVQGVINAIEKLDSKVNSISYEINELKNREYNERNRNWSADDLP